jgi:threonine aldolase
MYKSFASDNNSGIHPQILKAIEKANNEHFIGYGDDPYTTEARKLFKEVFGANTEVFFALTGTGANVCALQNYVDRFEAVICTETAHINVDECGAPEHCLGAKLLTVKTDDGKLCSEHIDLFMHFRGDQHHVQPKIISITQATELGTVYTLQELKHLVDHAHSKGLKVHMDGARLANAVVASSCSFKEITTDIGIDVLSFGGTKNGMMLGEAIVFFNEKDIQHVPFIRKQNMQLISKMRYISAQFIPYLSENVWYHNAKQANDMAMYLYENLSKCVPEIIITKPDANALFVKLPKGIAEQMQKERFFYTWDEHESVYRFMTSFDMDYTDIDSFVEFVKSYI